MKTKLFLFIIAALLFYNGINSAKGIDWKNISFGFSIQYLNTDGDLNEFWGNTLAGGILLNYKIDDSFSLEGGILGSNMKPKSSLENLPNFIFLNIPAGLKYSLPLFTKLKLNSFAGIQNHSFIYSGEAADLVKENDIEHELGLFLQIGFELTAIRNYGIEVNAKIQNIFTSPEQLKIINIGLTVYIY